MTLLPLKLQGATCDGLNDAVVAELVVAHGQRAELELPGVDGEGVGVTTTAQGAPGVTGAPKHFVVGGDVVEVEGAGNGVVLLTTPSVDEPPTGHGAGVVMATFGFIEGAAFGAVVARADVADNLDCLIAQTSVDHTGSGGVLETGHDFVEIGEGALGAIAAGVAGHQEGGFSAESEAAHVIEVVVQSHFAIVAEDALVGDAQLIGVHEIAEPANMGQVLPDELIDETAVAELELRVNEIAGAHDHVAGARRNVGSVHGRANLVAEVLAVEEMVFAPGGATGKEAFALGGELVVVAGAGEGGTGLEGGQVPELHLRVGTEILDVHGVVLAPLHDAVPVAVPAVGYPGETEGGLGLWVERLHPLGVAAEAPITVELDDTPHLAVGGSGWPGLGVTEWQTDAETH